MDKELINNILKDQELKGIKDFFRQRKGQFKHSLEAYKAARHYGFSVSLIEDIRRIYDEVEKE